MSTSKFGADRNINDLRSVHKYGTKTPTKAEQWKAENRKLAEVPATLTERTPVIKKKEKKKNG